MLNFWILNAWFIKSVGMSGAATSRLPLDSGILTFCNWLSSSGSLDKLWHVIMDWMEQCTCGSTGYATRMTFSTTSKIICKSLHTFGLASWKLNTYAKKIDNSSQVVIVLRNSAVTYQDLSISSRVWIKAWTHSSLGHDTHKLWHSIKLLVGSFHFVVSPSMIDL